MTYRDQVRRVQGSVVPANSDPSLSGYDPARPAAVEGNDNHHQQLWRRPWRLGRPSLLAEGYSYLGQGSALCRMVQGPLMRSAARPRRCASCSALCSKAWSAASGLACRACARLQVWGMAAGSDATFAARSCQCPVNQKSLDQFKDTPFPRFQLGVSLPSCSLFLGLTT